MVDGGNKEEKTTGVENLVRHAIKISVIIFRVSAALVCFFVVEGKDNNLRVLYKTFPVYFVLKKNLPHTHTTERVII